MAAPLTPANERMSFWSRHDPVIMPRTNTDHWSIMRQRAEGMGAGNMSTARSTGGIPHGVVAKSAKGASGDGRVDPRGDPVFSSVGRRDMHGAAPGNYTLVRSHTSTNRNSGMRACTSYSMKAKEGFKYWYQDRPNPTSFGRYGIGSYKTVLGIGNAPRT